jgi:DNA repair protein RadC
MERPREKLLAAGAGSLSDAELLAVFLQTGIKGKTALELARDLLLNFGSLISANYKELCSQPGIGVAKAAGLAAMKELSLRQMMEGLKSRDILTSSAATRDYLRARFKNCESEVFSCLFLNNQHHVMELEELFRGTIDGRQSIPGKWSNALCTTTRRRLSSPTITLLALPSPARRISRSPGN